MACGRNQARLRTGGFAKRAKLQEKLARESRLDCRCRLTMAGLNVRDLFERMHLRNIRTKEAGASACST